MVRRSRIISLFIITISCLFVVILSEPVLAQTSLGAKSMAMGQTGAALPFDSWSVFNNPALLSPDELNISFYGFRYAGISEISDMAAAGNFRSKIGVFGVGIHRYGFNLFNENQFRLVYKNRFDHIHFGISAGYFHILQGGEYGSAGALGIDAGIALQVTSSFWIGVRTKNINQPKYGDTDEELPREFSGGLSFNPTERSQLVAEVTKDVMFPASFRTGLEVELFKGFTTRAGVTTNPSTYSFGFGYDHSSWSINFAIQQHNPLGLSPALDLSIRL
ncbi:PorV/PorQ family protein [Rhodohalobacter halophilus]|uniref:hypothetical protein n=1 Tax=Rhodohalobacter halophilus TaxID=1812810 RepID=UPI00114C918D|nr:hypothetical protein [Rhodohalobacter halophilus]